MSSTAKAKPAYAEDEITVVLNVLRDLVSGRCDHHNHNLFRSGDLGLEVDLASGIWSDHDASGDSLASLLAHLSRDHIKLAAQQAEEVFDTCVRVVAHNEVGFWSCVFKVTGYDRAKAVAEAAAQAEQAARAAEESDWDAGDNALLVAYEAEQAAHKGAWRKAEEQRRLQLPVHGKQVVLLNPNSEQLWQLKRFCRINSVLWERAVKHNEDHKREHNRYLDYGAMEAQLRLWKKEWPDLQDLPDASATATIKLVVDTFVDYAKKGGARSASLPERKQDEDDQAYRGRCREAQRAYTKKFFTQRQLQSLHLRGWVVEREYLYLTKLDCMALSEDDYLEQDIRVKGCNIWLVPEDDKHDFGDRWFAKISFERLDAAPIAQRAAVRRLATAQQHVALRDVLAGLSAEDVAWIPSAAILDALAQRGQTMHARELAQRLLPVQPQSHYMAGLYPKCYSVAKLLAKYEEEGWRFSDGRFVQIDGSPSL